MLDYIVLTPTYNRGELLLSICERLAVEVKDKGFSCLHIIRDDASSNGLSKYRQIRERWGDEDGTYRVSWSHSEANMGRAGFWKTLNALFAEARHQEFRYSVMIPDDCIPCDGFLQRITERFAQVQREDTRHTVVAMNLGNTLLRNWGEVRYLDDCFICDRRFFEALNWALEPCVGKWGDNPRSGSGTGFQITKRMKKHPEFSVAINQDVNWLQPVNVPSAMYPNDVRPPVWWRNNFIDKNGGEEYQDCQLSIAQSLTQRASGTPN